jgi:hypothetical protein
MSFWDNLWDRLQGFGESLIEWVILIAVALVVLLVGRWIARVASRALGRILDAKSLDGVWARSGVAKALGSGDQTPGSIAQTITYAYLLIALLLVVARILTLTSIEDLLTRLLAWIPLLLLAAAIVIIAAAAGNWAAGLVRPFAASQNIRWLTYVVQFGVVVFGLLFALDLLEISFAEDVVKIMVAAAGIALAIAFGIGGIDTAKKWWAKYAGPSE